MRRNLLVCPECKSALKKEGKTLLCTKCSFKAKLQSGYVDLINKGYYWGEIPPSEMDSVIRKSKKVGWKRAVGELIEKYPKMEEYLLNHTRLDWLFHCLPLAGNSACLDIGSGWGNLSFDLAKYYKNVYSLEEVRERVEFQALRKRQDRLKNLHIIRGDFLELPFDDSSFDLVVVSGVLEWVGIGNYDENPASLQREFLKEVYRILKPGGCLYVGIENRFGLHYLLGAKDHSGLPYTGFLPRYLADLAVRFIRKTGGKYKLDIRMLEEWRSYRTYTYTLKGYRNLFSSSGFAHIEPYWTLFYSNPKFSGPIDGENFKFFLKYISSYTRGAKGTAGRIITTLGKVLPNKILFLILKYFTPSYLFFCYKDGKGKLFQDRFLRDGPRFTSFLRMSGSGGLTSKINYFLLKNGKVVSLIKFPRFKEGIRNFLEEESLIQKFGNVSLLKRKRYEGQTVFFEKPSEGEPLRADSPKENRLAVEWLINFQERTKKEESLYGIVAGDTSRLKELLLFLNLTPNQKEKIKEALDKLLGQVAKMNLPLVSSHGDFCAINILKDKEDKLYVLDWEDYSRIGSPLTDFIFYFLHGLVSIQGFEKFSSSLRGDYPKALDEACSLFLNYYNLDKKIIFWATPYTALLYLQRFFDGSGKHFGHRDYYLKILRKWASP